MRILTALLFILLSFNASSAVVATWDFSHTIGGTTSCTSPCTNIPPELVTLTTVSYDNHPGNPTPYVDLFVFEKLIGNINEGQLFVATSSNSTNFDYFVSRLTNGVDEALSSIAWLGDTRNDNGLFTNSYGGWGILPNESEAIIKSYSNTSPDLFGYEITSIELLLTTVDINVDILDSNNYSYNSLITGTVTFNAAVPVPAAIWLFLSGFISIFGLSFSKRFNLFQAR